MGVITHYYLKTLDGRYLVMRKITQPPVEFEELFSVSTEDLAKNLVDQLNKEAENEQE